MPTFELFRFEELFLKACSSMLKEALGLIGCKIEPKVFLVGFYPKLGFATIVPDEREIETNDFETYLSHLAGEIPPFPDDAEHPDATEGEWAKAFGDHQQYLSECAAGFREFIENELRPNFQMVTVSPSWVVNGRVVA